MAVRGIATCPSLVELLSVYHNGASLFQRSGDALCQFRVENMFIIAPGLLPEDRGKEVAGLCVAHYDPSGRNGEYTCQFAHELCFWKVLVLQGLTNQLESLFVKNEGQVTTALAFAHDEQEYVRQGGALCQSFGGQFYVVLGVVGHIRFVILHTDDKNTDRSQAGSF